MSKSIKRISLLLALAIVIVNTSCAKKMKHKWMEKNPQSEGTPVTRYGVQTSKGTDSNAVPIYLAIITFPAGAGTDGKPKYKHYEYEMDELTEEGLDEALKKYLIVGDDALFCGLEIMDSEVVENAGPSGEVAQLTKKGVVRYANLSSPLDNSEKYEGKFYGKDIAGMINEDDIATCITQTFAENFQLVSCEIEIVDASYYDNVYKKKK